MFLDSSRDVQYLFQLLVSNYEQYCRDVRYVNTNMALYFIKINTQTR